MTTAIVLAGGAATRFGADKLAVDIGGRPLLHHALERVGSVAEPIVLVLAPEAPPPALPPLLAAIVVVARDAAPGRGPLAGLAAGLAALADADGAVLVVGGDMPDLQPAVLAALVDVLDREPSLGAAVLEAEPRSPLPLAVRPSLARPAVDALLRAGRRSLLALVDTVPAAVVPAADWRRLDPAGRTLRDVDTAADIGRG